ncbi:MAG: SDR family oxidoreductase [Comamonadaceae bacterium]|nr:MAG: SDR family oxidoreductase [Comamonadaceae bacterium]
MSDNNSSNRLSGKTAIVTGAGRGIGAAIAQRLANDGAQVLLTGRQHGPLEDIEKKISQAGGKARVVTGDISVPEDVDSIVSDAVQAWGRVDILVNNAAVFDEAPFMEVSLEAFRTTFDINVLGTFLMSQRVAKEMIGAHSGSIVHISSIDIFGADGPVTAYTATKAAVSSMARTMTMELAPLGIRVNTVAPGFINADMLVKTSTPAVLDHMMNDFQRVPLRRLVEPEEVAAAVAFLASNDASAITGIDLVVDGGLTANLYAVETLPEPMIPLGAAE